MPKPPFSLVCAMVLFVVSRLTAYGAEVYVSPQGADQNPGTLAQPVATLARAQELARAAVRTGPVTVYLRGGVYYLAAPIVFGPADSGSKEAPVVYEAYQQEKPVVSGGFKLTGLNWQSYQNGILQTPVSPKLRTDQLFVNGERQLLARYPNYDPTTLIYHGYAADAISPARVARWADPAGGFFHAMHASMWGGYSFEITGKKPDGTLDYQGGWQNNRPGPLHDQYRYVENIFEELDAPNEWFLNTKTHTLYYYPPAGLDLNSAVIEAPVLKELIEFRGSQQRPVRFVSLKGITFRHTLRTFMETKEPILRSDWTVYRGGAILFSGAEDCSVENSFLDQLGGNSIFVNNYNRGILVRGCHIYKSGAGGVTFVGDVNAVRNPLFKYEQQQAFAAIDQTPGPLTDNYPAQCLVDDCLIHETGQVEKQSAPIGIDISQNITVRHCSIYDCPRAGINIGDGCWGGHVIEFCDVFDTVKETGDHGSFNSWGRDRWWGLTGVDLNKDVAAKYPNLPILDAMRVNTLRNNRWRCDHGWDIDLDDGSTNYDIRNNLCLNGGIKNREGFYRTVENNIMVNDSFCPHVWYTDSQDVFRHNIVWEGYKPASMPPPPWGRDMDYNLLQTGGQTDPGPAPALQKQSGRDEHSISADARFFDAAHGDYRATAGSPALLLGFVDFVMDQFGVQKPDLKAIARTPELPGKNGGTQGTMRDATVQQWEGASVRNIRDQGEMSAFGTPGVTGQLVLAVDPASNLAKAGLKPNDVILALNSSRTDTVADLVKFGDQFKAGEAFKMIIMRSQALSVLSCVK